MSKETSKQLNELYDSVQDRLMGIFWDIVQERRNRKPITIETALEKLKEKGYTIIEPSELEKIGTNETEKPADGSN
jgi:hypothetical protein